MGAAIGAKLLSEDQPGKLQDKIAAQAPGLSDLLDLDSFVARAGSVVLWINLMARLLLYCAAWATATATATATAAGTGVRSGETAEGEGPEPGISPAVGGAPQRASAGSGAPAAPRFQKHGP